MPATHSRPKGRSRSQRTDSRLRIDSMLTRAELRQLQADAAADLRSVGSYVGWLIARDLDSKPKRQRSTQANETDRREPYGLAIPLSAVERRKLEQRAAGERRSLSNYVTALILEELAGRR